MSIFFSHSPCISQMPGRRPFCRLLKRARGCSETGAAWSLLTFSNLKSLEVEASTNCGFLGELSACQEPPRCFTLTSFNLQSNPTLQVLKIRKLRHSEVKTHSQGHTEVAEPEFEPTTVHELNYYWQGWRWGRHYFFSLVAWLSPIRTVVRMLGTKRADSRNYPPGPV